MSAEIRGPAPRPCESCPYRRDVPSGVWDRSEYEKLPGFDEETFAQPPGVFLCHQQDGRVCAGWCGTRDMSQSLGLRLAIAGRRISPDDVAACLDFSSPVPLFKSGSEAAAHGLAQLDAPGSAAVRIGAKIVRRRS
jgi:hypothetical protein